MTTPKLACCNFIDDVHHLRSFALDHGFDGVDWTFTSDNFPQNPAAEAELMQAIQSLHPLEVRFHCAFAQTDLGDEDPVQAAAALRTFQAVCRLVSKLQGPLCHHSYRLGPGFHLRPLLGAHPGRAE